MANIKLIFPNLPELERKLFLSQLVDAMTKSNEPYYMAKRIVEQSDENGLYENIKYLNIKNDEK